MKKDFIALISYIIILGIDFYLLPCLAVDTGTAMFLMLCVMPLIAFISSVIYGVLNSFNIILPIVAFTLFLPTIFIHYNTSAWVYSIIYAIIVAIGNGIGGLFYGKR